MGDGFVFTVGVRRQGALLRTAPASVTSCIEDSLWQGVLTGAVPNGPLPAPTVEPVWAASGDPAVRGVRVTMPGGPAWTYDTRVFEHRAHALIRELVLSKEIGANDDVEWEIEATAAPTPRFRSRPIRAPYPLQAAALDHVPSGALAITMAPRVLEEIRAQVLAVPTLECAGILAGRLAHDAGRGAALLSITAQVPVAAGAGGASGTHFAFGANSFQQARKMLATMGEGTLAAGWFHSHPACAECPRTPSCRAHTVFFSADDIQVHSSAFPAAYTVALVAGKVRNRPATDPGVALYAWQHASLVECTLSVTTPPGTDAAVVMAQIAPQAHPEELPKGDGVETASERRATVRVSPRAILVVENEDRHGHGRGELMTPVSREDEGQRDGAHGKVV